MPALKIETSVSVNRPTEAAIVAEATTLLGRELGCPTEAITITLTPDVRLMLAGSKEPAAFAEITTTPLPPKGRALGEALAMLLHQQLGVPSTRVYVKFIASTPGRTGRAA